MKLNSQSINQLLSEQKNLYQLAVEEPIVAAIIEKENNFIEKMNHPCSRSKIRELNVNKDNVDYEQVHELVSEHPDQRSVSNFVSCLIMSNAYMVLKDGTIKRADNISQSFHDLTRIGDPSAYGIVLRGKLFQYDNFYTLKVSQSEQDDALSLHELVVGIHLNKLRKRGILNFVYTYGSFKCSPPILDTNGKVLEWCSSQATKNATYVIYEDLGEAPNLSKYIDLNSEILPIASAIVQLALATRVANDVLEYTHYDLHPGNVLMRKLKDHDTFYIPYVSRSGNTYYVIANAVATIIDYGSVFIDGYGTPEVGAVKYGKYRKASPLHDMYKLVAFLCNTALNTKNFDKDKKEFLLYLMRFFLSGFSEARIRTFLQEQYRNFYVIPEYMTLGDASGELTINDFIDYVFASGLDVTTITPKTGIHILDCMNCFTYEELFDNIVVDQNTIQDLYRNSLLQGVSDLVIQNIDLNKVYSALKEEIEDLAIKSNAIIQNLYGTELTASNFSDLNTMNEFRDYYTEVVRMYALLDKVVSLSNIVSWIIEKYGKIRELHPNSTSSALEKVRDALTESIKRSLILLNSSALVLKSILGTVEYENLVSRDANFKWYKEVYPVLLELTRRKFVEKDITMKDVSQARSRASIVATRTGNIITRKRNLMEVEK